MSRSSATGALALVAASGAYVALLVRWFRDPAFAAGGSRQLSVWPFAVLFLLCAGFAAFRLRDRLKRMRDESRQAWGLEGPGLIAWAIVILVSFVFQAPTMLYPAALLHSDAAINGLMAMHIAAGRVAPAFYYGQEFMGTFFSHALALLFVVTGPFVAGAALMTWLFYAGFLTATFFLVRQATRLPVAVATTLWLALAPYSLLIMMARSEYPQLFLLSSAALAVFAARACGRVREDTWWLALGVLLGLAFWSHPMGALVAASVFASAVVLLPLRAAVGATPWIVAGFVAGFAPAVVGWGARIVRFAEWFVEGGGRGGEETIGVALAGMMRVSLPNVVFGTEGRMAVPVAVSAVVAAVFVISAAAILVASLRARRAAAAGSGEPFVEITGSAAGLPVCLFVLIHITVLVARRYDVVPAQYVIPLQIGIPAFIAIGTYWLLRIWTRHAGVLTAAAVLTWACAPLPGSVAWLRTLPENQASMEASIGAMRAAGIDACVGPYWDAYRISFLALEEIVCESADVRRVPGYADEVARRSAGVRPPFVAAPQRESALRAYQQSLAARGITATRLETPRFIVLMPPRR